MLRYVIHGALRAVGRTMLCVLRTADSPVLAPAHGHMLCVL